MMSIPCVGMNGKALEAITDKFMIFLSDVNRRHLSKLCVEPTNVPLALGGPLEAISFNWRPYMGECKKVRVLYEVG